MIAPARVAAYSILSSLANGRADLSDAVARARASLPDSRDRALATEIATGVERWRAALDHLIVQFARRPVDRLDSEVVTILRLSLYQLLHLTRVPAAAVVDDAVDLAKRAGKQSASGFVNAVLRAAVRQRKSLPLPARPAQPDADRAAALEYLSVTLSHPTWLARRWLDRFGFEIAETWATFNNQPAPLTVRANVLRTSRNALQDRLQASGVETAPGQFAPYALIVQSGHPDGDDFVIQDEASQIVTLLAGASPGPFVLDACAAPGGKATAIAAAIGERMVGRLIACDVRSRRISLLRRTIAAAGAENIRVVQADLLAPLPFGPTFDCVLVDAPCSGLGTLRRDPDIKWRRQESDLAALASRQLRMLKHAASVVKPGGRLIYATCSSEPEENEEVVDQFLRDSADFIPIDAATTHPLLAAILVDQRHHLRTTPHAHGLECFFGAVLERK